jgi:hypothetical protein
LKYQYIQAIIQAIGSTCSINEMDNQEVIYTNPLEDPKWGTPEGAQESARNALEMVKQAMQGAVGFKHAVLPASRDPYDYSYLELDSPLEFAVYYGMEALAVTHNGDWDDPAARQAKDDALIEETRQLVSSYPPEVVVLAAAAPRLKLHPRDFTHPVEALADRGQRYAFGRDLQAEVHSAPNQGAALKALFNKLDSSQIFQDFCTPTGRVEFLVAPYAELATDPESLESALQYLEADDNGNTRNSARALRVLFSQAE